MSQVTVTIDGIACQAKEGEFILNVARRNDIFIPALCYLTNCSPTLACRLCLVDIDGKRAYACNAKAKEGMNVITKTDEIQEERRAIMEVYDVNHPLECGVCDQSGECELQNYTLEMGVDSQHYCIQDTHRPARDWGHIHYDPSLCIVCERCVTVCKDMVGFNALKTVPRGGEALPKTWKEEMPKDSYAMWNKLQKSIIGLTSGGDMLDCSSCGECASVCPVGALVPTDFQYKSNAWELKKIPASNPHSSDCSLIFYDVKHTSVKEAKEKIYRVSSEVNYAPLHGAARFGFDFENEVEGKDKVAFDKVVSLVQDGKVDTIEFNSFITNEEALILQKMKEKFGLKLVNKDAYAYKKFLEEYRKTSGKSLYSADIKTVQESNFVVSLGSFIKSDSPNAAYAFNNALTMNKGAGLYFHPVGDPIVKGYAKNMLTLEHTVGSEVAALYLMLDLFGDKEAMPSELKDYLESFHEKATKEVTETIKEKVVESVTKMVKDEESGEEKEVTEEVTKMVPKKVTKEVEYIKNNLWAELGLEDQGEALEKLLLKKDTFSLIAGEDLYSHPDAKNLANLLGMVDKYTNFSVLIIPSRTNTLGVSLLCDLDAANGEFTLGYNVKGDFTLSSLGKGELDMPSLNQQEGTFTNMNKRVVPTNAALGYNGYCLNDIASALGLVAEYTIEYTEQLPESKGFTCKAFDDLPNSFDNAGVENRGYLLKEEVCEAVDTYEKINKVDLGEEILYQANPILQFSEFTNKAHQLHEAGALYASPAYLKAKGFEDGSMVKVESPNGHMLIIAIKEDNKIDGLIPYLPTFDRKLDTAPFFEGYRFAKASIKGVNNE